MFLKLQENQFGIDCKISDKHALQVDVTIVKGLKVFYFTIFVEEGPKALFCATWLLL